MRTSNGLFLLKVDWITWEVSVISKHDLNFGLLYDVVVDQSDRRKVCVSDWSKFVTGTLVDDNIVFSPRIEVYLGWMHCTKLTGNQLCGLRCIDQINDKNWLH
jgi:hypothetical protein